MGITHLSGLEVAGVPTMGLGGWPPFTGNWYFVDPAHGTDGGTGAADSPVATLYRAYALCRDGYNDVVVLVGNGAASGSARLSTALAQTITPAATTGTLTWAKNACHLLGMTAPTGVSQRARIAPPTGTYTQTTFGSGNFVVVTGTGCMFANFSVFNGFSTGGDNQIAWTDSGGRNFYQNVQFGGAADAASGASTSSRSLLVTGSTGENTFVDCTLGLDTVARTAANSTIEIAGGSPRNTFTNCTFPAYLTGSGSSALHVTVGASGIDRWVRMVNCDFFSAVKSGGTAMTQAFSLNAAAGGLVALENPFSAGVTAYETASSGVLYITGNIPTFATSGKSVNS